MKLEKASAIAEIISSIAIVVTLVYLGLQTQQNTDALIAVSRQAILQADLDDLALGLAYPDTTEAFRDSDMSPEEQRRQIRYIYRMRAREFAWFQYRSNLLDEATWQSYLRPMRGYGSAEGREFIEGYLGDPEFKAYLLDWLDAEAAAGR